MLIAARNEERNVLRCLQAMERAVACSRYAAEVLVGDDASADRTQALAQNFAQGRPAFSVHSIAQVNQGRLNGKANVLLQLIDKAQGELLLISDADTEVNPEWINGMVEAFGQRPEVGIVTGFTVVAGRSLASYLQGLDWINAIGLVQIASWLGVAVTTMGNNMAVRRQAYEQVGGYEQVPFSVTEDLALFKMALARGWGFRQISEPRVLAYTQPIVQVRELFRQRRRWFTGALEMPPQLVAGVLLNGLFLWWLLALAWAWPVAALWAWAVRFGLQAAVSTLFCARLGQWRFVPWLPVYEVFITLFNPLVFIYYLFTNGVVWKGRLYKDKRSRGNA